MPYSSAPYAALQKGAADILANLETTAHPRATSPLMWVSHPPGMAPKEITSLLWAAWRRMSQQRLCIEAGCFAAPVRGGRCKSHPLTPGQRLCSGPECQRPAIAQGLCATHYHQRRRGVALAPIGAPGRPKSCRITLPPEIAKALGPDPEAAALEILTTHLTPQKGSL